MRGLLRRAGVTKPAGGYPKAVDLALVIRDRRGRQVTLSWGEVFYHNPSETVLALASRPVMPHKKCAACHQPDVYGPLLKQLKRRVVFPKLVLARDFYNDRSLEGVVSIEVVGLPPGPWGPKQKGKLYSPGFRWVTSRGRPRSLAGCRPRSPAAA